MLEAYIVHQSHIKVLLHKIPWFPYIAAYYYYSVDQVPEIIIVDLYRFLLEMAAKTNHLGFNQADTQSDNAISVVYIVYGVSKVLISPFERYFLDWLTDRLTDG